MMETDKNISQKRNNLFWLLLFVIGLIFIWKTQRAVPVMMDDEWYSTVLSSNAPLSSLHDIVQAQIWHYQNWGGRTIAHTMAQLIFLYLNEPVADALNVLMIILLARIITVIMDIRKETVLAFTTLTVGFLHGLNANWKMSMYWQTGACNYLYTTVLIMLFLHMYLREQPSLNTLGATLLAPVLGLLCGWTNENMGPTVWILTILVMLLKKHEKRTIPFWMVLGSTACLLGSTLLILAPGNNVRSAEIASNKYGMLWQLFLRIYGICKGAWEYLFPVIFMTAAALFINICILKNSLHKKDALLLTGALLSWGAMVLSPHYPDRASFGTLCFLLCVLVSQSQAILQALTNKRHRIAFAGIGVFIWLKGMYYLMEFLSICWGWIR